MKKELSCQYKNSTYNIAVCKKNCSSKEREMCPNYNRNLALNKTILEEACELSDDSFNKNASIIRCSKKHCPNHADCTKVLSPIIALSEQPLRYSEFSGNASVISPNYITIDLHSVVDIKVIQFLLWDNRGNDKKEACNRQHYYRLLVSDYADDLERDEQGNVWPKNKNARLKWSVIYDSLRSGYNGWQVFNFSEKRPIRYIKIHFLYNSDHKICNLVRFEAYGKDLVGYDYNFLPTFETTIYTNRVSNYKKSSLHRNPINKFTKEILARLERKIKYNQEDGAFDIANEIMLFKNELQSATDELAIYESRLNEVKQSIFNNTDKILHRAQVIKYVSIALGIIGFLFNFI